MSAEAGRHAENILARQFLLSDQQVEFAEAVGYAVVVGKAGEPIQYESRRGSPPAAVFSAVALNHFLNYSSSLHDLFNSVDNLYCDLDHPDALEPVVSYMPTEDPEPTPNRLKQKIERLRDKLLQEHFLRLG